MVPLGKEWLCKGDLGFVEGYKELSVKGRPNGSAYSLVLERIVLIGAFTMRIIVYLYSYSMLRTSSTESA